MAHIRNSLFLGHLKAMLEPFDQSCFENIQRNDAVQKNRNGQILVPSWSRNMLVSSSHRSRRADYPNPDTLQDQMTTEPDTRSCWRMMRIKPMTGFLRRRIEILQSSGRWAQIALVCFLVWYWSPQIREEKSLECLSFANSVPPLIHFSRSGDVVHLTIFKIAQRSVRFVQIALVCF